MTRKKGKKEQNNKQNSKDFLTLIFLQLTITKRNRKTKQEITEYRLPTKLPKSLQTLLKGTEN